MQFSVCGCSAKQCIIQYGVMRPTRRCCSVTGLIPDVVHTWNVELTRRLLILIPTTTRATSASLSRKVTPPQLPYLVVGGRSGADSSAPIGRAVWHDRSSPVVAGADWLLPLGPIWPHFPNEPRMTRGGGGGGRGGGRGGERRSQNKGRAASGVERASFVHEPSTAGGRKDAREQEGEIENLHPQDRWEGHRPDQALHEREVSGVREVMGPGREPLSAGFPRQGGG